ncbi:MAG: ABC transporter [Alphaproteobacteria bacterium]|nr:MAG: ABC transporter [Alphaproteobacteria bacterium]
MAGLDPAIHPLRKNLLAKKMDARVKPAHDDVKINRRPY